MLKSLGPYTAVPAILLSACVTSQGSSQSHENVVPFDEASMRRAARYCARDTAAGVERQPSLCGATFYCGEGGCDSQNFVAVLPADLELAFRASFARLPIDDVHLCRADDEFESQYANFLPGDSLAYFDDFEHKGGKYIAFCGDIAPGYENDVVLELRKIAPDKAGVVRTGGEAGSPPAHMKITEQQFLEAREAGSENIRQPFITAVEKLTGEPCDTAQSRTCSVIAERGKLKVSLLFSDGALTGRAGHWEQAYIEVYPNQPAGDYFELGFDMPITSIRRWPADRAKPTTGFTALDFDEGFESFRFNLMSLIAENVGGTPVEPH
ncbi:hypothetical protein [Cereibacter sphaeroides]|uniref:hypothetical protein n=1 Tax=Cereibacter sphaeroides TaxID=1063 RepID=UPI000F54823D|nr:hypothetical protein [Cereibacter sphaeroides]AZB70180.1 hypothetical protein EBL86_17420 [Cereibacter sphaeroides]